MDAEKAEMPKFYDMGMDDGDDLSKKLGETIEYCVYSAVKEIFEDDPDGLMVYLVYPGRACTDDEGLSGLSLRLMIDGYDKPSLTRVMSFAELIEEELEDYRGGDGHVYLDESDKAAFEALASELEGIAKKIRDHVQQAVPDISGGDLAHGDAPGAALPNDSVAPSAG